VFLPNVQEINNQALALQVGGQQQTAFPYNRKMELMLIVTCPCCRQRALTFDDRNQKEGREKKIKKF
jgi:hypothetical protein